MKQTNIESNPEFSQNIKVSHEELAKRRIFHNHILARIAVGDSPINPKTRHIFNDFIEGRIATTREVREKLIKHYSQIENE